MMKNAARSETDVIGWAWRDDITFEEIERRTGLTEKDVIVLMRRTLKPSSFRLWRKRVSGRKTKHAHKLREHLKAPAAEIE